jgi:hypothetical protein
MGSRGRESLVHVTRGGGEPWASQARVTSSPAFAVTLRVASASCDPFTLILGLAVGESKQGCELDQEGRGRLPGSRGRACDCGLLVQRMVNWDSTLLAVARPFPPPLHHLDSQTLSLLSRLLLLLLVLLSLPQGHRLALPSSSSIYLLPLHQMVHKLSWLLKSLLETGDNKSVHVTSLSYRAEDPLMAEVTSRLSFLLVSTHSKGTP